MATREELLEKYKDQQFNKRKSGKKSKRRNPFGADLDAIRNNSNIEAKSEIVPEKEKVSAPEILAENLINPVNPVNPYAEEIQNLKKQLSKLAIENESLKKRVNEVKLVNSNDKLDINVLLEVVRTSLEYSLSEKDATKKFLLYLLKEDCPVNEYEFVNIEPVSMLQMDRTSFNYARLSLTRTGAFEEGNMPGNKNGRPKLGFKFSKSKFFEFINNNLNNI